jgi:hypothetical protein
LDFLFSPRHKVHWEWPLHQRCVIKFGSQVLNIYDTASLNEDSGGSVSAQDALQQLYNLLHDVRGIILLVLVTCLRIMNKTTENYRLIREIFTRDKLPTVVAITNREFEEPRKNEL